MLLEQLSGKMDLLWVIMGDFNEILHDGEKVGGNQRPTSQMKHFRDVINRCNLRDLGYVRSDFTWCRCLGSRGWIRERLDRAFVSTNWATNFVHSLGASCGCFNHQPLHAGSQKSPTRATSQA